MQTFVWQNKISVNPQICFGKPCIKGTRIWVSLILEMLASGNEVKDILANYPQLTQEDIFAALSYGAAMSHEHFVEIMIEKA